MISLTLLNELTPMAHIELKILNLVHNSKMVYSALISKGILGAYVKIVFTRPTAMLLCNHDCV